MYFTTISDKIKSESYGNLTDFLKDVAELNQNTVNYFNKVHDYGMIRKYILSLSLTTNSVLNKELPIRILPVQS